MMRIVVLDGHTLVGNELSWEPYRGLGEWIVYPRSKPDTVLTRSRGAEVLVTNKVVLSGDLIEALPDLKMIAVTATGYNVVDIGAARRRGIPVCNVPEYGTQAVAQHVFAMLLAWIHRPEAHRDSVNRGDWIQCPDFSYSLVPPFELAGKRLGIVGWGRIGRATGELGRAFGMEVVTNTRRPESVEKTPWANWIARDELFETSDVVSLHCPLTAANEGFVNRELLRRMRPTAILINTARGGLVNEADLAAGLAGGKLAAALLDVVREEPMAGDNPLRGLPNCLITPHIAWAAVEARKRCMETSCENIRAFLEGQPRNVVNGV